ncbi:concanavalin A-like lectin/glucanase [Penicillium angulare]|uniref:Concanavalin A-like lectin/glucanase n=1 Tax=Penicillium angulare TaxID=116970 RepID=A0A9W9KPN1_9EURO|nr:concanavalin A-like lectin/glucanase [Penicillium angulare]
MLSKFSLSAAVWAAIFSQVAAQSYTSCDPMEKTCAADQGTTSSELHYDFTESSDLSKWTTTAGTVTSTDDGAKFTISESGDAPTIETDFYIFFGEVTITMQGAPGTGIVSSAILESDDLDEIDWEILGSYTSKLQTDYYGKGDSGSYDRWTWVEATTPQSTFHTYKWVWTEKQLTWSIDGTVVRTLTYDEAVHNGASRYPQTPMSVRIGIWAGGDPGNNAGTISWAGGDTDYSDGPFSMYVKSVSIVNYNPAESYRWKDKSGSMDSIEVIGGTGTGASATTTGYYLTSTGTAPASVAAASGALWRSHPSGASPRPASSLSFSMDGLGALSIFVTFFMAMLWL